MVPIKLLNSESADSRRDAAFPYFMRLNAIQEEAYLHEQRRSELFVKSESKLFNLGEERILRRREDLTDEGSDQIEL